MLYSLAFLTCLVQSIKNGVCIVVNNKYISLFSKLTTVYFILPEVGCCKRTDLGVIQ